MKQARFALFLTLALSSSVSFADGPTVVVHRPTHDFGQDAIDSTSEAASEALNGNYGNAVRALATAGAALYCRQNPDNC